MISIDRKKRGKIDKKYIKKHSKLTNKELLLLLIDNDSQKRTVAATLLGQRKYKEATSLLCSRLSKEKMLYTKIAISNALINFGTSTIKDLINYIGKIGKNQHKKLPENIFKKKSYPLPRDIIIRIIIRMGDEALYYLPLHNKSTEFLSEIVDAIGHITFTTKNHILLDHLLSIFDNSQNHKVLKWKVIRAFQSFSDERVIDRLKITFLKSNIACHRWEALRSLSIINTKETKALLEKALKDPNPKIVEMAKIILTW